MNKDKSKSRMHAIYTLQGKMSQSRLWGPAVFIVMSIAFGVSSLLLINTLKYAETNIIIVEKQPMFIPIMVYALLVSLYLSFSSMVHITREYDQKTYELLLYGPVDESAFILGNFFAQVKIFLLSLAAAFIWTIVCAWQLNLTFSADLLGLFLAALLMTLHLVALGILLASLGRNTRNSVLTFLLILLLFVGIALADTIVSSLVMVSGSTSNDPLLIVRDVLVVANNLIKWVSPYSLMANAMNAVLEQTTWAYLLNTGLMLVETILYLFWSIFTIQKKGVRTA